MKLAVEQSQMKGTLAIALLEEFYQMGCITVATTHYGEIKRFSECILIL